jgi:AcrR family transcriptional regulator
VDEQLSRRERKKIETRQRLMAAALRLFHEQGFDDTTVEQITDAADVAKGTFFNYFETKESVLPAVAEWRLQHIGEIASPQSGAPDSPVARIKLVLRLVADDPISDPRLTRHLMAAVHHMDHEPARALMRLLAKHAGDGQDAGEIRSDLDPIHVGGVIRSLFFQQMLTWHCGYRPGPLPDLLDAMVDLLMDGIAAPAGSQTV